MDNLKGQLKLLPTDCVDELLGFFQDLQKANASYSASNHSIRTGRKLRKLLLSIQKTATTARAEVLTRRKIKATKQMEQARLVSEAMALESDSIVDPNQTSIL